MALFQIYKFVVDLAQSSNSIEMVSYDIYKLKHSNSPTKIDKSLANVLWGFNMRLLFFVFSLLTCSKMLPFPKGAELCVLKVCAYNDPPSFIVSASYVEHLINHRYVSIKMYTYNNNNIYIYIYIVLYIYIMLCIVSVLYIIYIIHNTYDMYI